MTYVGPSNPRMLLVGEAWGEQEAIVREPFVGTSGQELWRILGEAMPDTHPDLHSWASQLCAPRYGLAWVERRAPWLKAARVGFTNVLNIRPPGNQLDALCVPKAQLPPNYPYGALTKGKYLKPEYFHEIDRLRREVTDLKPNLVVAMGNAACWALLGTTGITAIRGTTVWSNRYGVKVLPTYHPASILYEGQWSNHPILVSDMVKADRQAEFPQIRRPPRSVLINPSLEEVRYWISEAIIHNSTLSVDIETSMSQIDTIGFSRSRDDSLVIPFGPHRYRRGTHYVVVCPKRNGLEVKNYWTEEEERQVWRLIKMLLESPLSKVFQNGLYDLQYLYRMSIRPSNCTDDTMLLWHALYPEMPKSLGFLGSMLTDEAAWKQLNKLKSDTTKRDE